MRYLFLIYSQETSDGLGPEETETLRKGHSTVMQEARKQGVLLAVERLKSSSTATTVRVKEGGPITLDGPFAETKEQLAGFYMLECQDLDEAIEWARAIPTSCRGSEGCIEIRPLDQLPRYA